MSDNVAYRWAIGILVAVIMSGGFFSLGQRSAISKINDVKQVTIELTRRVDKGELTNEYIVKTLDEVRNDIKSMLRIHLQDNFRNKESENGG